MTMRNFQKYISYHSHTTYGDKNRTLTLHMVRFFVSGQLEDAAAHNKGLALRMAYKRIAQLKNAKRDMNAPGPYWEDVTTGDQLLTGPRPHLRLLKRNHAA